MINTANKLIEEGFPVAAERIFGVNDNMSTSHYHEFFELYYLESGERYHLMEDNLHLVTPEQFIIFEPYQLHHSYGKHDIPFSRLLVYFREDIIAADVMKALMNGISGVYQLEHKNSSEIYFYMNEILKEQNEKKEFYQENMINLINQILILIFRNKNGREEAHQNNKVTEVISYINLNYMHKITLQQLSGQFYISQWYLCREFKYYTHTTITKYINSIRIIQSQKMLLEGKKKIIEISSDVGFDSITHFERVFKQVTGKTPREYKKQSQIGKPRTV